mgnify:CR=1 FL=1
MSARIAVLVSGGGTNLQALIDAQQAGTLHSGTIALVVSNAAGAYALERAKNAGIPGVTLLKKQLGGQAGFEKALQQTLEAHGIDVIVLAGFMTILSGDFTNKWPRRILNIHPALIPSFCGEGFYGLKVHEAALQYGVKVTGATVHFVNSIPDGGEIIAQKAVEVLQKPESDAALHLPEHTLRRIRQTGEAQVEEMLARCEKLRLSILWYGDEAYPPQLLSIVNPPVLLFYQGDSSLLQEHLLLTIVGTRNPSPYSLQVEKTICHDLVQMGFVPVTGYAVGIDITANRCALEADKPSIALMGCGLDVAYPQPHANLKYEIARRGLILSEFLPGTSPAPSNFPLRNRVLSGLSMGTFVIQAPARSGALITAENAMEQGRDVFCIPPADIFDKRYMGVIKYLRDGAIPVFDSRDIVYEYYTSHAHMIGASALYDETREKSESSVMTLGESDAVQQPGRRKQRPPKPEIPEETEPDPAIDPMPEEELEGLAGEILSLLQRQRVMHMDQIAAELEVSMEELTTTLTELELYGKLERLPGKQFRRMR